MRTISDKKINIVCLCLIVLFAMLLMVRSLFGPIWYHEIDTNVLPVISLQYRGSLLINQSDIEQAQIDFPEWYDNIQSYDDLRSSKLVKVTETEWMSFYFQLYPMLVLPVKLIFQLFGIGQMRAFLVTNTLLILAALWTVYKKLNTSPKRKLLALVLLMLSPIVFYNNYLCYETLMFSFVTISLVMYSRGSYKLSALFLSLAGMPNPTVMTIGMVMIAEYLIRICWENRALGFIGIVKKKFKDVVLYGVCYVPCLIPFAFQFLYRGQTTFVAGGEAGNIWIRLLTYLFDPTLGFFTFAPLQLLLFFVMVVVAICRKRYEAIPWAAFLLSVLCAVSLMYHINCGMYYCARYLVWIYPVVSLFIVTVGFDAMNRVAVKVTTTVAMCVVSCGLLGMNYKDPGASVYFNESTQRILEYCPSLYRPYSATFYCRTLHIDGGYYNTEPAYYKDRTDGYVRKMIYRATPEQCELVINSIAGDEASMEYVRKQMDKTGMDGKFHYLNFPRGGKYQIMEKPEPCGVGDVIALSGEAWNGNKYFTRGISGNEGSLTWTNGKDVQMIFIIPDYDKQETYLFNMETLGTYNGRQRIFVSGNGERLYDGTVDGGQAVQFALNPSENGIFVIDFQLPDAVSPAELGQSEDTRVLSLALTKVYISVKE